MNMKRLAKGCAAVLAVAAVIALSACGSSSVAASSNSGCTPKVKGITTVQQGALTVGAIDIVPFSSYNAGSPKGIDESIVEKIAKDNCLTVKWQQATYADAVQSITSGTIDLAIGCIDATAKRLQAVDFSASTYLDGMGLAAAKSKNVATISNLEKLNTIGTVDGYLWVNNLKTILGSKLKTYPSSVELKADFDAGRLDVAIDAYGTLVAEFKGRGNIGIALANKTPDKRVAATVQAPEAAFPYTKGNTNLGRALTDGIKSQRNDGTITKLLTSAGLSADLGKVSAKQYVVPAS